MKTDHVDWPIDYSSDYPDYKDPDQLRGRLMADIHSSIEAFAEFEAKFPAWAYEEYNDLIDAHTKIYDLLSRMYRRQRGV